MDTNQDLIYGETLEDLWPAFRHIASNLRQEPEGSYTVDVRLSGETARPLERALSRAEAQLLLEDADALAAADATWRTPGQRRFDAFMLVVACIGRRARAGAADRGAQPAFRLLLQPSRRD
jgi:hypothetical protein